MKPMCGIESWIGLSALALLRREPAALPQAGINRAFGPLLATQQALVAANRELITRFEQKIQTTLARIWGEETATNTET